MDKNQKHSSAITHGRKFFFNKVKPPANDSLPGGLFFIYPGQNGCRNQIPRRFYYTDDMDTSVVLEKMATLITIPSLEKTTSHLLTIKGNILYDVSYRSNIDTPYAQKDVYQHTVQIYADLTWKDKYPFRVYLTNRFGNSTWFRKYTDFNLQYNPDEFANKVKRQLLEAVEKSMKYDSLEMLKKLLDQKKSEYNNLQNFVRDPALLQKLVEERERQVIKRQDSTLSPQLKKAIVSEGKITGLLGQRKFVLNKDKLTDSIASQSKKDSLENKFKKIENVYADKRKRIDSLAAVLKKLDSLYQKLQLAKNTNTESLRKEIEEATTTGALKDKLQKLHIADSVLPRGYKTLFALKKLGIGRSIADYSELSAKNISITGLQVEYNPHYYYALAAGTVDYRFRDYIIPVASQQKQYLALLRVGKGSPDGNHLIFTWYTGRRQLYNTSTSNQAATIPNYNLMGLTIEGRYQINRTSFITAELAKSSLPYYSLDSTKGSNLVGNIFKMDNRSNEAYALKLTSFIPPTHTSFDASYRRTGANFQSFSLFTTGAAQTAWSVRLAQPFFNNKLQVVAGIRENDFINTFTNTTYQSNAVLKSLQATLRLKKWPILTFGYFPSSQLTKLSDTRFTENLFYTLTGSASKYYSFHGMQVSSMLLYTQFYNTSSDSGFVYFNTRNLLVSQSASVRKATFRFNFSVAANSSYHLYVIEQNTSFNINKWLSVGAGLKYNKQTVFDIQQWGYSANARFIIPVLGDLQLMMDKGFIPGANRQLVQNNMGRLTYFKTF